MQIREMGRRIFLKAAVPLGATPGLSLLAGMARSVPSPGPTVPLKLSCNLYSFNSLLRDGTMRLEEVLEFCSDLGFAAVDPTAYYFPNYPELPPDDYLYEIKRRAFRLGLDISGTGIRNDFTLPNRNQREAQVELVKKWVGVAARLGAPVLRVFAGRGVPDRYGRAEVTEWVVEALQTCAGYGSRQGVLMVLQNHWDFIRTAEQTLEILTRVDSPWLALNLDIGSYRGADPYQEIARVASYAATWQIKENVFIRDQEVKTDLDRIVQIVLQSGYRGYLPIETLGTGDPRVKVPRFLSEVRSALAHIGQFREGRVTS